MTVHKSIIEEFELSSGVTAYVQASRTRGNITFSFDGPVSSFSITADAEEAKKLSELINKVLKEKEENDN
jgi:hypothetical protein